MTATAERWRNDAAADLERDLKAAIAGEVRFDTASRAAYSTDGSNYRQVPIGVVVPHTVEDVVAAVAACRRHGAPITSRGGGTSLAGQTCNVAVVIDFSKHLNRILDIDSSGKRAWVQPGCVLDVLRNRAERFNLTFGPDPATHDHNTLGGMIGNNSCGVHSVMAGRTADNVDELEILTYDGLRMRVGPTGEHELEAVIREGGRRGEIYKGLRDLRDHYADAIRERFPKIPRRVSGFNLPQLLPENGFNVARALVGTEGTCVVVLEAGLRLVHSPPCRVLLVLGYPDIYEAGDHVPEILEHGPVGLEGIDDLLIDFMKKKHVHAKDIKLLPEGNGWLLVEFGGDTKEEAVERARGVMEALGKADGAPTMHLYEELSKQSEIWEIRESGLAATAHVPGMAATWPGWEDAAVAPDQVGAYLREFRQLLGRYDYHCSLYGHFGDGCIHCRIDFELVSTGGIDKYRRFVGDAADLVLRHRGSFSGEHGDGQARGELLPKMYGDDLVRAFREFKAIWDPGWKMNPGKVIDPDPITANLRLGAGYQPKDLKPVFAYPEDHGDFTKAALRCVGVGKCRHPDGGVMCPSYMATGEELHSTRGRARLLFEMVRGDPITDGWKSEAVREALDLCLACKGCKSDCPVNVDMATYKAEFYHHYYKGRLRPRAGYSMGLIWWWARAASHMPELVNGIAGNRWLAPVVKWIGGIAPERELPAFADETFTTWFRKRGQGRSDGEPVILWPDTFNNYFHPHVARAAVAVLERAGYTVMLPGRSLCCGRPLYAWGMLDRAKKQLADILRTLEPHIAAGVPVIGLEPACLTAFRDELPNLFPDDARAKKLCSQSFMLSEFLAREEVEIPSLHRAAVVHAHCNHHAIIGMHDDCRILDKLGLDYKVLESGCCGMAGSFGFEEEHYDVSMKAGERVLLPAVRAAPDDCLIITDGYSCREQIAQATTRRALHLAEVLDMAGRQEPRQ